MTPSIRRKLDALAERHEEVGRLLAEPDASADPKRFRDLSREYAQLEPVTLRLREFDVAERDLAAAEAIIELQVEHYLAWWRATDQQDTLKHLRRNSEAERDAALARAGEMLAQGRTPQQALEFLAHTLTNKLLHAPSANLRAAALRGDRELLHAAARLFDRPTSTAASLHDDTSSSDMDADDPQHPPQTRRAG